MLSAKVLSVFLKYQTPDAKMSIAKTVESKRPGNKSLHLHQIMPIGSHQ